VTGTTFRRSACIRSHQTANGFNHRIFDGSKVGVTGTEHSLNSPANLQLRRSGAAQSGAVSFDYPPNDPELAIVIKVWPSLPALVRESILSLIQGGGVIIN
jgi:hypothetical protein